jgi:hypothetical protein
LAAGRSPGSRAQLTQFRADSWSAEGSPMRNAYTTARAGHEEVNGAFLQLLRLRASRRSRVSPATFMGSGCHAVAGGRDVSRFPLCRGCSTALPVRLAALATCVAKRLH